MPCQEIPIAHSKAHRAARITSARLSADRPQRVHVILIGNLDKLHTMAKLLLEYETIDVPQIDAVMDGRDPPPPVGWGKSNGKDKDEVRPLPPIGGPAAQT